MRIKLLHPSATPPKLATPGSAGYDLCAVLDAPRVIGAGSRALIGTGVAVEIPEGLVGLVQGRSGLFRHEGLQCITGTIDSDYRGEVGVMVHNTGRESVTIEPGQRIAQLVLTYAHRLDLEVVDELSDTSRGAAGFGSTGR
jgi:dUTP pyrophosphatase